MNPICIYCGKSEASERDHVPPKCFFSTSKPPNLITVPSCRNCNSLLGKDDERVRNLIVSLDATERHETISNCLADKRNRSFDRQEGTTNFRHVLQSMQSVDVYSNGGIYLGTAPAFNLDQPLLDRFMSRMCRGLLHHENAIGYVDAVVEWHMANVSALRKLPSDFLSKGKYRKVGNIFAYLGFFMPQLANSLWFFNFFGGFDVVALLKQMRREEQQ